MAKVTARTSDFLVFCFTVLLSLSCLTYCSPAASSQTTGYSARARGPAPAKRYTIDLDLPPEQRWVQVAKDHEASLKQLIQSVKSSLPSEAATLVATFGEDIAKYMPYPYGLEIVGMADAVDGLSVSDVVLGNILYELTAYGNDQLLGTAAHVIKGGDVRMCTSIVAQTVNGTIYHGRNLDYSFPDLLRDLTIIVDFQLSGETLYTGTTFAGMVGLLTGQKPNVYTVSVDERDEGSWWMNAIEALLAGTHGISTLHVRDALADKEMNFEDVVDFLSNKRFIAPCYIIVGGTKPGEGAVITRDRTAAQDVWRLDADNGRWFLVETNYDHWLAPPKSDDRRDPAIKAMNDITRGGLNATSLFNVMSTPPVLNSGTTYTVVMSAAVPEVYNSWVRSDTQK